MTPCRITLFGGLRVQQSEREITRFSTQKTAALLAYLAYYRHQSHPREVLIEMLWPECEPDAGRGRLRTALWSLRRQLEPPGTPAGTLLHADTFAVGLNPAALTTDVAEFLTAFRQAARASSPEERGTHLKQAVALYAGELLPGFYEDWVLREQRRLADLHEQVVRYLTAYQSQTEDIPLLVLPETMAATSITDADTSLPLSFTRFFGREEELARLQEMLSPLSSLASRPRLVTITGTGGTGKTRLSLEVARRLLDAYSGAVWFAPLADLRDPALMGSSLVEALFLPRSGNIDPLEQVIAFLKERQDAPTLLVLDNFEQLVEGGAEIVQTLLERVPALTLLVTSRRLLHLSAERELALLPLPVPEGTEPLERLTLYESVQLFIDRAQNARPDFQVTNKNAPAVAELCHRLEGIPLALELAAARALMLTPAQMLSQMERRFAFLVSKKRDVVARHKTLQAAIEWSYRLLSPELQRFFARLSVFRGGWTLEAAEAVCEEPQALEYLEQLREWSLIQTEETEQGMRFTMLETLREYGAGRLQETAELSSLRKRHAAFFLEFAEQAAPGLVGAEQASWLNQLEAEHDNLRAAIETYAQDVGNAEESLRLTGALGHFWSIRGYLSEGQRHLDAACARPGDEKPTRGRAKALQAYALLASGQGDYLLAIARGEESLVLWQALGQEDGMAWSLYGLGAAEKTRGDAEKALRYLQESLQMFRRIDMPRGVAAVLNTLSVAAYARGDYEAARRHGEESLSIKRQSGDKSAIAVSLDNLGVIAYGQGDTAGACIQWEQGLAIRRELGERQGIATALNNLGYARMEQADYEMAHALFTESLILRRDLADREGITSSLENMARLATFLSLNERAIRLFAAAGSVRAAVGSSPLAEDQAKMEAQITALRTTVDRTAFQRIWEQGEAMTWEEAVAYALEKT